MWAEEKTNQAHNPHAMEPNAPNCQPCQLSVARCGYLCWSLHLIMNEAGVRIASVRGSLHSLGRRTQNLASHALLDAPSGVGLVQVALAVALSRQPLVSKQLGHQRGATGPAHRPREFQAPTRCSAGWLSCVLARAPGQSRPGCTHPNVTGSSSRRRADEFL
jgi:hypothetical protein